MACRSNQTLARAALVVGACFIGVTASACSSTPDLDLSDEGERGRALAAESGCVACHGNQGQGGVGPAWVGLVGSTVPLDSGESVAADTDYLQRSIAEPGADQVSGFNVLMPTNNLSEAEIEAVVTYIQELG